MGYSNYFQQWEGVRGLNDLSLSQDRKYIDKSYTAISGEDSGQPGFSGNETSYFSLRKKDIGRIVSSRIC